MMAALQYQQASGALVTPTLALTTPHTLREACAMAVRSISPGDVFDRWTVVTKGQHSYTWACRCECGTTREVRQYRLLTGGSRSCGCLWYAKRGNHFDELPEYGIWADMIQRCTNPSRSSYPNYGGRGIRVDSRWRESFESFLADVGPRPSPDHTLDRIENAGHYEPGNVRWATRQEQASNRRSNVVLTFKGETRIMSEWATFLGLDPDLIQSRLKRGWSPERALTEPVRRWPNEGLTHNGKTQSHAEWARAYGMTVGCLRARLRAGWPVDLALTEPVR